jgi:hypothetical protein
MPKSRIDGYSESWKAPESGVVVLTHRPRKPADDPPLAGEIDQDSEERS